MRTPVDGPESRTADNHRAQDRRGRKRLKAALRASEERFERYLDLGLIGMAIASQTRALQGQRGALHDSGLRAA